MYIHLSFIQTYDSKVINVIHELSLTFKLYCNADIFIFYGVGNSLPVEISAYLITVS